MSLKNFMSYGDAEPLFTRIGNRFGKRPSAFLGTQAEWAALTDAQKAEYRIVNFTDDDDYIGNIVDEVIEGEGAAISSNAVALELVERLKIQSGAGFHNSIYRGKFLGNEVTADQYDAIDSGTFDDLYIGDYWTIDGVNYRIADFDYWINCGDTACTKHHVVIVPDTNLDTQKMNDSDTTAGGYAGSKMKTSYMATAKSKIVSAFGSGHILVHRELFTTTVANGIPTAGAWADSDVDLMNEPMVYGSYMFSGITNGTSIPYIYTIDKSQLALFRYRPDLIGIRTNYWLRDIVSAATFAHVYRYGHAYYNGASLARGVRPAFALVKLN